jgi:uncharacterized protein YuzE
MPYHYGVLEGSEAVNISIEFDNRTSKILAAYIHVSAGKIARTIELKENVCNVDEDEQGNLVGVEILVVGDPTWVDLVAQRYGSSEVRQFLLTADQKLAAAA